MLDELHIRGIGVIDAATLRLSPGLTVVTGETGAGKTMLVNGLQLLLGARADTSLVRAGVQTAVIEARVVPPPANAYDDGWLGEGDDELVVSREVPHADTDGRSRARVAGRLATISTLDDVLGRWVEVHAQGSHLRLGRPTVQRRLLDRYADGEHLKAVDDYRATWQRWRESRRRLEDLEASGRQRAREMDRLRHEIAEIDEAEIDPEEAERLDDELSRLEHAEELATAAVEASHALADDRAGGPVGIAVDALRSATGHDPELDELGERVEGLAAEMTDVRSSLRDYGRSVSGDEARLEQLRARQRRLGDLQRKYGADLDQVLAYAAEARRRLETLESEAGNADELADRVDEQHARLRHVADDLHHGRVDAAKHLAAAVSDHLADLGMPRAAFDVRVTDSEELGSDGRDEVEFVLAANPGEPSRAFARAASGGERSRVALAIEVALARADDARVLVFDEVDAGVGGETAMAVGEKLARLAAGTQGRQVLCVTHLAQLAAFADRHYVVDKHVEDGRTVTSTRRVADDDRAAEIARMLSGRSGRDAGLRHAETLLAEAVSRLGS